MPPEKEFDKGVMHTFFGHELCDGCKGLLVVAYITPSQKDISSFAAAFSRQQAAVNKAGAQLKADAQEDPFQTVAGPHAAADKTPRGRKRRRRSAA